MAGDRARTQLATSRFGDVRWVAETGSTNADLLSEGRSGAPEGVVLVADHQTAGRGRRGRVWEAPAGASLLLSVLLRPPVALAGLATMVVAVAAAEAMEAEAGVKARLKWPNDLVWPGDASAPDRKLAGILAEADWPAGVTASAGWREPPATAKTLVVVGMGLNVNWPGQMPAELADIAVAANQVTGRELDRESLLIALLQRLDAGYSALLDGGSADLLAAWRARSATLGRRVRVDLGVDDVEGTAVDVTAEGLLVVEAEDGTRRTFAVGDVVHLR